MVQHAAGEKRNTWLALVEKSEEKRPRVRPRRRGEDIVKMNFK
jgi:hypothetical protein